MQLSDAHPHEPTSGDHDPAETFDSRTRLVVSVAELTRAGRVIAEDAASIALDRVTDGVPIRGCRADQARGVRGTR